jgi:hypothetical protein
VLCCRAFCVEKNSAAPDVQFKGNDSTTALLVVPYVEFVLTEVLKNALQVGGECHMPCQTLPPWQG